VYKFYEIAHVQELLVIQEKSIEECALHSANIKQLYAKGLLAKVELLEMKSVRMELRLHYELLKEKRKAAVLEFNNLLNQSFDIDIVVDEMERVVHEYDSYQHWVAIVLKNNGIVNADEIKIKNLDPTAYVPRDIDMKLRKIYILVEEKKLETKNMNSILEQAEAILGFQKKRFKNSIVKNVEVLNAINRVARINREYIQLLYTYHTSVAEADIILQDVPR